ncbi:pyridoxal 5'-phosphate synthase subunit PDX1.3-like [Mangifera indica]|uniref:pyridoxal 5'-phosphate synthase subunit PDX1.3-like n=1 Tax=Mangifera indica TaxID=29780 RepID=UPI001CFB6F6A|nr:pyridoxal 5'-phosphate synthase subunit PDX1.3-like [Mangifera indica]
MADGVVPVHNNGTVVESKNYQFIAKWGPVQKLQGGTIIKVTDVEQAKIAEEAGSCSIVIHYGASRPNTYLIKGSKQAEILEAMGVDYVDESELLGIADSDHHINKHTFHIPFACKCQHLEEGEGAMVV